MKKIYSLLLSVLVLFSCNTPNHNNEITQQKLCKTWHMDKITDLFENGTTETREMGQEYKLSYLKYDCENMAFAQNGMSKQADGSYKEYYVQNGKWELLAAQRKLVQFNMWAGASPKIDTMVVENLADHEMTIKRKFRLQLVNGKIEIGDMVTYICNE